MLASIAFINLLARTGDVMQRAKVWAKGAFHGSNDIRLRHAKLQEHGLIYATYYTLCNQRSRRFGNNRLDPVFMIFDLVIVGLRSSAPMRLPTSSYAQRNLFRD